MITQGFLSCAQVRDLDRRALTDYGIATLVLMENAGRGAAEALLSLGVHGPVVVCGGKGNNGGDGLVMARHLQRAGIDVKVLLFAVPDELSPDAATNWRTLTRAGISHEVWPQPDEARLRAELARAEWVVDALFGTGFRGPMQPPYDGIVAAINASPARIFAVDIPSGLDGDTGEPQGVAVRARHTATFVAPKKGFANPAAGTWVGKVHVIDIGAPAQLVRDVMGTT
jgi:NAD(P)H-hydrate epimerase